MSLKNRILKNGLASVFQKTTVLFNQLLLVPFFLKFWGTAYYGEWLTLAIIPSLLAFADFGFGSAASSSMVLVYADDQKQTFVDMAKTGRRTISGIVILILAFSFVAILLLNHFHVFDNSIIDVHQAIIALLLLISARVLNFYHQLYEGYYRSARKAHRSIYLFSAFQLSNIFFTIIVLIMGGHIIAYASVNLILAIFFLPIYIIIAQKTLPIHKHFHGQFSYKLMKHFIKIGFGYLMAPLWQVVLLQGTILVVRITLGPVSVALFSTVRTIANSSTQFVSVLLGSTFPDLQFELGAKRIRNAQKIFKRVIGIAVLIGLTSSVFFILFGEQLYRIWTDKTLDPPRLMWIIFMSSILFKTVWWASTNVFRALNKPYLINVPCLIASAISVIISYLLINKIGITGTAIGILIMDIIIFIYAIPKATSLIELNSLDLIKEFRYLPKVVYSTVLQLNKIIRQH